MELESTILYKAVASNFDYRQLPFCRGHLRKSTAINSIYHIFSSNFF
ncbi:hypothetical protein NQ318_015390 [Aromia moschata]|uniref:Uncharacterized protein n=1 Tax=Aromia moschata TaxID=1265417 RepID=A0AAV8X4P9_9CUCU|nr:hypothetical protein NQ318_015390 [Aromia moschata]